jgi:hypothetical protein
VSSLTCLANLTGATFTSHNTLTFQLQRNQPSIMSAADFEADNRGYEGKHFIHFASCLTI